MFCRLMFRKQITTQVYNALDQSRSFAESEGYTCGCKKKILRLPQQKKGNGIFLLRNNTVHEYYDKCHWLKKFIIFIFLFWKYVFRLIVYKKYIGWFISYRILDIVHMVYKPNISLIPFPIFVQSCNVVYNSG